MLIKVQQSRKTRETGGEPLAVWLGQLLDRFTGLLSSM